MAATALLLAPAPALAATTPCPPPPTVIAEVPGGPVLFIAVGAIVVGLLALLRRRGGAPPAALATLVVVLMVGAVAGMTIAGAATDPCSGVAGAEGGVQGISTGTPLTGAAIPWITGAVLLILGLVALAVAAPRRRSRRRARDGT
jgi:amino acid transporter